MNFSNPPELRQTPPSAGAAAAAAGCSSPAPGADYQIPIDAYENEPQATAGVPYWADPQVLDSARQGALGNTTRSAPAPPFPKRKIGELTRGETRTLRYRMQDAAGQVLGKHRVASCQKVPSYGVQHNGASRGISKNADGHAHFHGVGSCGDVWVCPVCSQRISEGRRQEVLHALRVHRAAGGIAVLVTYTFSHGRNDDLAKIVKGFTGALSEMKGRKAFKKIMKGVGYTGQIRTLDVTHSWANGWHPHSHEILFLEGHVTPEQLRAAEAALFELWRKYAVKHGLGEPNREHGVDLKYRESDGDNGQDAVGAYVSKWGHELTYAHKKQGRQGGRSPWAILRDLTEKWTYRDAQLYREYAAGFKGKAQLFWSRGLKDRFEIEAMNDAEMSDRPESEHVIDLEPVEWQAIVHFKAQARVLEVAEREPLFLRQCIQDLVKRREQERIDKILLNRQVEASTRKHRVETLGWPDIPAA